MPDIPIDNTNDPRLQAYVNLPERQLRNRDGKFVVEGSFLVQRLLSSSCQVESLLVAEDQRHRIVVEGEIPVYLAPPHLLSQITGFKFHRAMLGCGVRPSNLALPEVLSDTAVPSTAVICSSIHDQENLGGILRNLRRIRRRLGGVGRALCRPLVSPHIARLDGGDIQAQPLLVDRFCAI